MKPTLVFQIFFMFVCFSSFSQTLYVPNLTSGGISESIVPGNVGIGTSAPLDKLHVKGQISIEPDASTIPVYINFKRITDGWIPARIGQRYGVNYGGHLVFETNSSIGPTTLIERMRVTYDGNVGIGTSTPNNKLAVIGSETGTQINTKPIGKFINTGNEFSKLVVGSDNANYDAVFSMDNSSTLANAQLRIYIGNGTLSTSGHNNDQIVLKGNGNVGIGTTNPGSFKLAVEGKIGAREVNVTTTSPWPDYVFEKNYNLLSLAETEAYIQQNKHLPEVPAAKEMEQNGINLSEMNMLLLKKVEELTLHLIDQNKKNTEQNQIIQKQNERLLALEKLITR